jgi:branched-chain amino acid transport system permease protein
MNYLLSLFIYLNIYAIVALSLNLVVGYCGLLTLAHAGYFAVGGYTYAIATLKWHWGFGPALFLAALVTAILSLAVSLPAWRFKGDFFVMVSLSVQALLFSLIYNGANTNAPLGSLTNLTNGAFGITGIPQPTVFGLQFQTIPSIAWLTCLVALSCGGICWLLLSSPWGKLLRAMRDDELVTRGLGKNTRLVKLQAFAIACGLAGVAGALYASYVNYMDASSAALDQSVLMTCMVIVGGVGNFRGPLVGAFLLLAIPEMLRFVAIPDTIAANLRLMLYGLLLVILMHLRPKGVAGEYEID